MKTPPARTASAGGTNYPAQHAQFSARSPAAMKAMDFRKKGMLFGEWQSKVLVSPVDSANTSGATGAY